MVDQFMAALEHPLKAEIERLRAIIIGANAGISEQIKWKAPSFCYRGDDRVTMKPQPMSQIQLIFHRGARPNDAADFGFKDNSGLLMWDAKDRAVPSFRNMAEKRSSSSSTAGSSQPVSRPRPGTSATGRDPRTQQQSQPAT